MAPSRLDVSGHAKQRLKQREISRKLIRKALNLGSLVGVDLRGRKVKEMKVGRKILIVVYLDVIGGQNVITAFWKGDFK